MFFFYFVGVKSISNGRNKRAAAAMIATALEKGLPIARDLMGRLFFSENGLLSILKNQSPTVGEGEKPVTVSEFVTKSREFMVEIAKSKREVEKIAEKMENHAKDRKMDIITFHDALGFSQLHTADLSQLVFQTLTYMVHLSSLNDCRNGEIPLAFVSPDVLTEKLIELQKSLPATKQLTFEVQDTQKYYVMKSANCMYDDNGGVLQVQVPITNTKAKYKLFEYTSLSFAWEEYTCTTDVENMLIVKDFTTNHIYPITETWQSKCDPKKSIDCQVPKVHM